MIEEILPKIPDLTQKEREKLDKALMVRPRVIALAVIEREDGALLLAPGEDKHKGEKFYRPLGGGVNYGELSQDTVNRELMEEIGFEVVVGERIEIIENVFEYLGMQMHEIMILYRVSFSDESLYDLETFEVVDSKGIGKAVWRTKSQIQSEDAKLYPVELIELV